MRKLRLQPVQYDIVAGKEDIVAKATRTALGTWIFQDRKNEWVEESLRPLELEELLAEYLVIRKRRNIGRKVREERKKAKAAINRLDLPPGPPIT